MVKLLCSCYFIGMRVADMLTDNPAARMLSNVSSKDKKEHEQISSMGIMHSVPATYAAVFSV